MSPPLKAERERWKSQDKLPRKAIYIDFHGEHIEHIDVSLKIQSELKG